MFKSIPDSIKSVYMIAICGTGMAALAGMLREKGVKVSGSDRNVYPPMSTFLRDLGIPVFQGFDEKHLDPPPDLVIIGNAMSRGNPEVEAVLERKLLYTSLPAALRDFFIRGKRSCVVAGTHGKTSTSALLACVLEQAGRDPGFFIGGIPENFGQGYKLGSGDVFISEGDEYDSAFFDKGSKFLHYLPDLVILNNIEFDHADIFRSFEDIQISFRRLINLIPRNGYLVACWDNPTVRELSAAAFSKLITFGFHEEADWRAEAIALQEDKIEFDVLAKREKVGRFAVPVTGRHMLSNCLGVIASAHILDLSSDEIQTGLAGFKGVRRRLQLKHEIHGIKIYDDFAHHPTEVKATIAGLKQRYPEARLWAIFEPRSATSKRRIFEEKFIEAFSEANCVVLAPLFRQDKVPRDERLSVEAVAQALDRLKIPTRVLPANQEMVSYLTQNVRTGDIVLFMSNGDFQQIPQKLVDALQ